MNRLFDFNNGSGPIFSYVRESSWMGRVRLEVTMYDCVPGLEVSFV